MNDNVLYQSQILRYEVKERHTKTTPNKRQYDHLRGRLRRRGHDRCGKGQLGGEARSAHDRR